MDQPVQEFQFLDLTDTSEEERTFLRNTLFTTDPNLRYPELPWAKQLDVPCAPSEWRPAYAVAPIPHPTLRGVFLPPTMYAPSPAALGLVPTVAATASGEGTEVAGPECDATVVPQQISEAANVAGTHSANSVYPMAPSSVPAAPPPSVMTTVYPQVMPVPNVYMSQVSTNVGVHAVPGYSPLPNYTHIFPPEVAPHEPVPVTTAPAGRNGREARRSRPGKQSSKRSDAQATITNAQPQLVESPPSGTSTLGPQGFPQYIHVSPMHHAYHQTQPYYSPTTAAHPNPHHIPHHPTAQHATGTPIYLSGPMYHAPSIYNAYPQAPGVLMPFPPMATPSVPTSENSMLGNYHVEGGVAPSLPPKDNEVVVVDTNEHLQKQVSGSVLCSSAPSFHAETSEIEQQTPPVSNNSVTAYQQQQSEEEDFTQSIVPSVVVNNSKMVNASAVVEVDRVSTAVSRVCVSDKASAEEELKRDKAILSVGTLPPAIPKDKTAAVDVKVSKTGDNVTAFVSHAAKHLQGISQQQTVTTTITTTASQAEVAVTTSVTSPSSGGKSWASLFKGRADCGMIITTGSPAKPLSSTKPFQNASPVMPQLASDVVKKNPEVSMPSVMHEVPVSVKTNAAEPPSGATDDPQLIRLGDFLSKYQLEHKAISLQPRGLTNRSNWCYINSTLQALLACPPFYNLMKAIPLPAPQPGSKTSAPIMENMVKFVNEFVPLSAVNRMGRKEKALRKDDGNIDVQCGAAFEPSYIYKMLNCIRSDTFKVEGRQEDAEEFLGCLLNALNDEMLELIKLVEEPANNSLSNGDIAANGETSNQSQDEEDTEWQVMGPKNKGSITRRADFGRTPISDIFRGQLRSRVQRAGDQSTDNVQPFFTLQLDIEKAQSVKDALEILVGRDQLEGVTCSRTNQEVEAWQQVTLEELPLVLLLHLKCFDYKLEGTSKIVKTVEFPIDLKVDTKLMSSNRKYTTKQRQYKLFAVVYHDGKEATKGHYITDVYHVGYGGWVRYDDSAVKSVQESQVLHPRGPRVPYLLYYRRCDTIGNPPPGTDKTR